MAGRRGAPGSSGRRPATCAPDPDIHCGERRLLRTSPRVFVREKKRKSAHGVASGQQAPGRPRRYTDSASENQVVRVISLKDPWQALTRFPGKPRTGCQCECLVDTRSVLIAVRESTTFVRVRKKNGQAQASRSVSLPGIHRKPWMARTGGKKRRTWSAVSRGERLPRQLATGPRVPPAWRCLCRTPAPRSWCRQASGASGTTRCLRLQSQPQVHLKSREH